MAQEHVKRWPELFLSAMTAAIVAIVANWQARPSRLWMDMDIDNGQTTTGDKRYECSKTHSAAFFCPVWGVSGQTQQNSISSQLFINWNQRMGEISTTSPNKNTIESSSLTMTYQNNADMVLKERHKELPKNQRRTNAQPKLNYNQKRTRTIEVESRSWSSTRKSERNE